jgi:drug/metabolite transporter (DMT)-like permease
VSASPLLGDALIFLGTLVWSLYTVLSAPLLKRYSATLVTSLSVTIGSVPLILIALPDWLRLDWSAIPIAGWTSAAFSGVFALALGYVIWNRGVKHVGGARTAVYSNLTPVIAALFAWIVRGDPLTIYHLVGATIILAGINLTRFGKRTQTEPLPAEE